MSYLPLLSVFDVTTVSKNGPDFSNINFATDLLFSDAKSLTNRRGRLYRRKEPVAVFFAEGRLITVRRICFSLRRLRSNDAYFDEESWAQFLNSCDSLLLWGDEKHRDSWLCWRLPRQNKTKCSRTCCSVCLCIMWVRWGLEKRIAVVLMFSNVVTEATQNYFIIPLCVSLRLLMVGRSCHHLSSQCNAYGTKEFSHKTGAVIRQWPPGNTIRNDSVVEKTLSDVSGSRLYGWHRPYNHWMAILHDYDVFATGSGLQYGPKDVHRDKI